MKKRWIPMILLGLALIGEALPSAVFREAPAPGGVSDPRTLSHFSRLSWGYGRVYIWAAVIFLILAVVMALLGFYTMGEKIYYRLTVANTLAACVGEFWNVKCSLEMGGALWICPTLVLMLGALAAELLCRESMLFED